MSHDARPRMQQRLSRRSEERCDTGEEELFLRAVKVSDDEHFGLESAPLHREWMNMTDQRFANRCLPLLIANQHGWVIKTLKRVSLIWDGSAVPAGLAVDAGDDSHSHAISHFGHGILTWRLPYLFKTPLGYNLLIRGPANSPKDGIAALEGIIETDWSPATATMNWKVTRPHSEVTFVADEAIALIVPIRRRELEEFTPILSDLSHDSSLSGSYTAWRRGREEFLEHLSTKPCFSKESWQGDYFRGTLDNGPHEHQTKLRLRPFRASPSRSEIQPSHQEPKDATTCRDTC